MDKEKVEVFRDLEKLAGQAIPIDGKEQDYVIISWRPSNSETLALDASYVIQHIPQRVGGGIPLDVKINPKLRYSQIILKTDSLIEDYEPFVQDAFGNIAQSLLLGTTSWQEVRKEVCKLYNADR